MAVRRSLSATIKNQTIHPNRNPLKTSTDYNFPIQTIPPLSLRQYARSVAPIPGNELWHPTGVYRPPPFHSYLSPAVRKSQSLPAVRPWMYSYRRKYSIPTHTLKNYRDAKPKLSEPIWHPVGCYVSKRPTSLSPEKIELKPIHEPVWQPTGMPQYKPVLYFDPPKLRWSIPELIKSVPDLRAKPVRASKKNKTITKSQSKKDN